MTLHDFIPTTYPELNAVPREIPASLYTLKGDNFISANLQGSFAVCVYDQHSDVEFIIVTGNEISEGQIQSLLVLLLEEYPCPICSRYRHTQNCDTFEPNEMI